MDIAHNKMHIGKVAQQTMKVCPIGFL